MGDDVDGCVPRLDLARFGDVRGARNRQRAEAGTRRQHQTVVANLAARGELDMPRLPVNRDRGLAQLQLDPLLSVERLRPQPPI